MTQVQKVLPEAVSDIAGGRYLGVSYGDLVPLLVEAIHELEAKVDLVAIKEKIRIEKENADGNCEDMLPAVTAFQVRISALEEENEKLFEIQKKLDISQIRIKSLEEENEKAKAKAEAELDISQIRIKSLEEENEKAKAKAEEMAKTNKANEEKEIARIAADSIAAAEKLADEEKEKAETEKLVTKKLEQEQELARIETEKPAAEKFAAEEKAKSEKLANGE